MSMDSSLGSNGSTVRQVGKETRHSSLKVPLSTAFVDTAADGETVRSTFPEVETKPRGVSNFHGYEWLIHYKSESEPRHPA